MFTRAKTISRNPDSLQTHRIREIAVQAMVEGSAKARLSRSMNGRTTTAAESLDLKPGEEVDLFRGLRPMPPTPVEDPRLMPKPEPNTKAQHPRPTSRTQGTGSSDLVSTSFLHKHRKQHFMGKAFYHEASLNKALSKHVLTKRFPTRLL